MKASIDKPIAGDKTRQPKLISRFRILTIFCLVAALFLLAIDSRLSLAIAVSYLILVLIAPYSFRLGLFLPVIYKGNCPGNHVSLTFDDGPDPAITEPLLKLLERYEVKAAFFVVGERVKHYPELIRRMVAAGHEIGNHSQTHDPILMLRRFRTIYKEIADCQMELNKLGIFPFCFRPPVGVTNPKLHRILYQLGLDCIGFSYRPRDFGNRRINRLADKVTNSLQPGSIILLHDKIPNQSFSLADWLEEIERIIGGIHRKGLSIVPLSELIARPVMRVSNNKPLMAAKAET